MYKSPSNCYTLLSDVRTSREAEYLAWDIVKEAMTVEPFSHLQGKIEILDEGELPPEGGHTSNFLGLHFDSGHPIFPWRAEDLFLMVALYFPANSPLGDAGTRILPIRSLPLRFAGGYQRARTALRSYAASHGSGWDWDRDSGHRVSCFARILDALNPPPRLTNYRETPKQEWYEVSCAGHEFTGRQEEAKFYSSCGVDLDRLEDVIVLQPGELLVFNNVQVAHGRTGKRKVHQIRQWLFGIRQESLEGASLLGHSLVSQIVS